jgi:hypothetical protein
MGGLWGLGGHDFSFSFGGRVCFSFKMGGFQVFKYLFLVVGGVGDTWIYSKFFFILIIWCGFIFIVVGLRV